jgi:hypothetical protein
MADDDSINKIVDAKLQFRLKKINDQLAKQQRKPITLKELMMRDRFDASASTPPTSESLIGQKTNIDPITLDLNARKAALEYLKNNAKTDELRRIAKLYESYAEEEPDFLYKRDDLFDNFKDLVPEDITKNISSDIAKQQIELQKAEEAKK